MRSERGLTLIEFAVVLTVVGVLIVTAIANLDGIGEAEAARTSVRSLAAALDYARDEAVRTGNHHVVFVGTDASGTALVDASGDPVGALVLNDGRPGSAGQNCSIDAGERVEMVRFKRGVSLGTSAASAAVAGDPGAGVFGSGSTFTEPGGSAARWVLFRPDGVPRAFDSACNIGPLGSGGGGFYLSNPARDVAVVLTPLGVGRVYTWVPGGGSWQ